MAAKILTEGGLNVVMLEAGPQVYPEKDYKMMMWPYELPHRGVGVGGRAAKDFGEFLAPNGAWKIEGEPYSSAPGLEFPVVPIAYCGRADESLGKNRATICANRLQVEDAGRNWR